MRGWLPNAGPLQEVRLPRRAELLVVGLVAGLAFDGVAHLHLAFAALEEGAREEKLLLPAFVDAQIPAQIFDVIVRLEGAGHVFPAVGALAAGGPRPGGRNHVGAVHNFGTVHRFGKGGEIKEMWRGCWYVWIGRFIKKKVQAKRLGARRYKTNK